MKKLITASALILGIVAATSAVSADTIYADNYSGWAQTALESQE